MLSLVTEPERLIINPRLDLVSFYQVPMILVTSILTSWLVSVCEKSYEAESSEPVCHQPPVPSIEPDH